MRTAPTRQHFLRLLADDDGATLVEYGFVIFLIAVVAISALSSLGSKVSNLFAPIAPAL